MKKFKLIKEYPGSPSLGTEVKRNKNTSATEKNYSYSEQGRLFCVLSQHVENNPEYWKDVNEYVWYVVFEEDFNIFGSWHPYCLETCTEYKNRFKTREEAEDFILKHKPCLSLTEVQCILGSYVNSDMLVEYIKKNKL